MKKALIQLHLSILLASGTGIFGKLINMSAGLIVFWRIILAGLLLWGWIVWKRKLEKVPLKDKIGMGLVGVLLMIQWVLFYASVKVSNVSIAVVCFSTMGFFTAIFEPIFMKTKLQARELFLSSITILGVALIFSFDSRYRLGVGLGLVSSLACAILAVYFRKYRSRYTSTTVMSYQLVGGFVSAACLLPIYTALMPAEPILPPSWLDFAYLVAFSSACTIFMYLLQIQALEKISAFTVNLSFNLEPIYSISMAMILFGEARELGWSFYGGLFLIVLSVAIHTWIVVQSEQRRNRVLRKSRG